MTIEKRTTEYVMPLIDEHSEGNLMTIRIAYMNGAKEQKKRLIEYILRSDIAKRYVTNERNVNLYLLCVIGQVKL